MTASRWHRKDGSEMTWLETVKVMVSAYYPSLRWHSKAEWDEIKRKIEKGLTEEQAEKLAKEIEDEADGRFEQWRQYQ